MKKLGLLFIILWAATQINAQEKLRIMTYNIEVGYEADMDTIGKYIKSIQPDVVALQEVDQWAYRSNNRSKKGVNQVVELASYADMFPVFAKTRDLKESKEGGYYGIGVLSKYPIKSYKRILLPQNDTIYEPRVMMIVEIDVNGTPFTIINTHLTLHDNDRLLQGKFLAKQVRRIKGPKVICGDFNCYPAEATVAQYLGKYRDALPENGKTFPALKPYGKIDYIMYDPKNNIQIEKQFIDTECNLSDHCPCYVDIIIDKK